MMASTDTGVTMTSGASVTLSDTIGGGSGYRALRLPLPLHDRFGVADRRGAPGLTR
jgi:hypothetical protein